MTTQSKHSPSGPKQSITKTVTITSGAGVVAAGTINYYVVTGFGTFKPGSVFTYSCTGRLAGGLPPNGVIMGEAQFDALDQTKLIISCTNVGANVLLTPIEIVGKLEFPTPVQLAP